jgi:hypothetical protein
MRTTNLRVELAGGPVNEYRIADHRLELRVLDSNRWPFRNLRSTWRRLTASELLLHFRLNTVAGRWYLEKTAEWGSSTTQQQLGRVA